MARRSFLRIGALGLGGLSLPQLLEAEERSSGGGSQKSLIMLYLPGGPTQSDTFDMKPEAPREVRGPFRPIETNVSGLRICELLPRVAKMMDKVALVRSVVGFKNRHESFQCYTGRPGGRPGDNDPPDGWPTLGSVVSKLSGPGKNGMLPYIDVGPQTAKIAYRNRGEHDGISKNSWPGFTGIAHTPLALEGQGRDDLVRRIAPARWKARRDLLSTFDQFRRSVDDSGSMIDSIGDFQRRALGILTRSRLAQAMDLTREDPRVVERYGAAKPTLPLYEAAPKSPQHLLLARRLIEAGARVVTVAFGSWDWHGDRGETLERMAREDIPDFDHAFSTFVQDLDERGMLEDTTVVVWGEMGRTPTINYQGGRDHWPNVLSALLIGGGMQRGVVVGSTDGHAAEPKERPVHVQEVFATLYHNLGIDTETTTITDLSGRPHYLVDNGAQPIPELVG